MALEVALDFSFGIPWIAFYTISNIQNNLHGNLDHFFLVDIWIHHRESESVVVREEIHELLVELFRVESVAIDLTSPLVGLLLPSHRRKFESLPFQ